MVDLTIEELEEAQDERAKILGYTLIRMWPYIIEPTTKFLNASTLPDRAALWNDTKLMDMLGSIRHEVGRHAKVNAYHQSKIDKLREKKADEAD